MIKVKPCNRYGIISNREKDPDGTIAKKICSYLQSHQKKGICNPQKEQMKCLDCLLVLGGDGTMLQAANDVWAYGIPLLGINLGTLGFLTAVEESEMTAALDQLMIGNYTLESRMLIGGALLTKGQTAKTLCMYALNDIVVSRSGLSRLIAVELYMNRLFVDTYVADGLIVSTPTGTTGYNLSAGGPIATPQSKLMVVTPICPHALNKRSIIVSENEELFIRLVQRKKIAEEAMVTFDGQTGKTMHVGDEILIQKAQKEVLFIQLFGEKEKSEQNFFHRLRAKL